MEPLISLCMIVKNEVKYLERCLESAQGLVDEIIIVDTGSTDRTKEIAVKYTDQIIDFTWINDFAAARNESIRGASGKWILILDADEYVQQEDKQKLRDYLASYQVTDPTVFKLTIMSFTGSIQDMSTGIVQSNGPRLFTNFQNIFYENAIHEQLACNKTLKYHTPFEFVIFHSGYLLEVHKDKEKSHRNLEIFEQLKQSGKKIDGNYCFYLANEYVNVQKYKEALYYYQKAISYLKRYKNSELYKHCFFRLTRLLIHMNRFKEAYDLIEEGIKQWQHGTDYLCLKGVLLQQFGLYHEAKSVFETCIALAEKANNSKQSYWIVDTSSGLEMPYKRLAEIHHKQLNISQTVFYLTKSLQADPKSMEHLHLLAILLCQSESTDAIIQLMNKIYPQQNTSNQLLLFLIFLEIGNVELAKYYHKACSESNQALQPIDLMRFALLTKNKSAFNEHLNHVNPDLTNDALSLYLQMAAIVWDNSYYDKNSEELNDDQVFKLAIELFKMQYFDEYDQVMTRYANPLIINGIANYFYSHNYIDLALDYYSLLLKDNELSAQGYLNLGMLYLNQSLLDDGLDFLQKSIELWPTITSIPLFLSYCHNPELRAFFKEKFEDLFPLHKGLPFIRNLC